jgi:hypothetical protein
MPQPVATTIIISIDIIQSNPMHSTHTVNRKHSYLDAPKFWEVCCISDIIKVEMKIIAGMGFHFNMVSEHL